MKKFPLDNLEAVFLNPLQELAVFLLTFQLTMAGFKMTQLTVFKRTESAPSPTRLTMRYISTLLLGIS